MKDTVDQAWSSLVDHIWWWTNEHLQNTTIKYIFSNFLNYIRFHIYVWPKMVVLTQTGFYPTFTKIFFQIKIFYPNDISRLPHYRVDFKSYRSVEEESARVQARLTQYLFTYVNVNKYTIRIWFSQTCNQSDPVCKLWPTYMKKIFSLDIHSVILVCVCLSRMYLAGLRSSVTEWGQSQCTAVDMRVWCNIVRLHRTQGWGRTGSHSPHILRTLILTFCYYPVFPLFPIAASFMYHVFAQWKEKWFKLSFSTELNGYYIRDIFLKKNTF